MFNKHRMAAFIKKIESDELDDFSPKQIVKKLKLRSGGLSVLPYLSTSQVEKVLSKLDDKAICEVVMSPHADCASAVHGGRGENLLWTLTNMLTNDRLKQIISKKDDDGQTPLWWKDPIIINKIMDKLKDSNVVDEFFMSPDVDGMTLLHNVMLKINLEDKEQCNALMNIMNTLSKHPGYVDILKHKNQYGQTPLVFLMRNAERLKVREEAILLLQHIFELAPKDKIDDLFFINEYGLTLLHLLHPKEAEPFIKMVKQETLLEVLQSRHGLSTPLTSANTVKDIKIYLDAIPVENWDEIIRPSYTKLSIGDQLKLLAEYPPHMRGYKEWIHPETMDEFQILRYVELTPPHRRLDLLLELGKERYNDDPKAKFATWSERNCQKLLKALPENDQLVFLNIVDPKFHLNAASAGSENEESKKLPDTSAQPIRISIDDGGRNIFTAAGIKAYKTMTRNT